MASSLSKVSPHFTQTLTPYPKPVLHKKYDEVGWQYIADVEPTQAPDKRLALGMERKKSEQECEAHGYGYRSNK
jgi:hypothetical protein